MCKYRTHEMTSVCYCMSDKTFKQFSIKCWENGCLIPRTCIKPIKMIIFFNLIEHFIVGEFNKFFLFFIFVYLWFITNMNQRRTLFELFNVLICVLFVQFYYIIFIFSPWIIRTEILFIGITFIIYLMSKIWRYFMKTIFFYICYSILFLLFSRFDCITNRFLSYNPTDWCFLTFILASNTLLIWCYNF